MNLINYKSQLFSSQNLQNSLISGHAHDLVQALGPLINERNCLMLPQEVIDQGIQKYISTYCEITSNPAQKLINMSCYNRYCKSFSMKLKKMVSKGWLRNHHIYLCQDCYGSHKLNNYCQYCEQIYSTTDQQNADDLEWIECELCQRWNHIDCEAEHSNKLIHQERDKLYYCHQCRGSTTNTTTTTKQKKQKKEIQKKSSNTSIHETYTNTLKDDPFVYDTYFNKKVNRKHIDSVELEYCAKKCVGKFNQDKVNFNTILNVTRDSKIQLSLKLSLNEDDIKKDLEKIKQDLEKIKDDCQQADVKMVIEENVHSQQTLFSSDANQTIQQVEYIPFPEIIIIPKNEIKKTEQFQGFLQRVPKTRSNSHKVEDVSIPITKIINIVNQKVPKCLPRKKILHEQEKQGSVSSRTRKGSIKVPQSTKL